MLPNIGNIDNVEVKNIWLNSTAPNHKILYIISVHFKIEALQYYFYMGF